MKTAVLAFAAAVVSAQNLDLSKPALNPVCFPTHFNVMHHLRACTVSVGTLNSLSDAFPACRTPSMLSTPTLARNGLLVSFLFPSLHPVFVGCTMYD
jgi:hypothetical protein